MPVGPPARSELAIPAARSSGKGADGTDAFVHDFRKQAQQTLPGALRRALSAYACFSADPPPDNKKEFIAYQAGCRAALAHLDLLLKLARWVDQETDLETDPDLDLDRLVREAEAALRGSEGD